MNWDELHDVLESLEELDPDVEKFNWGPSYEFAAKRQKAAIKLIKREIKRLENEN